MKIAIAAQHDLVRPNHSSDDWLVKLELEKQGISVEIIDWRDASIDLSQYDSIYVSSTWNAAVYYEEFIAWVKQCEVKGKKLINDRDLLFLGVHKNEYLSLLKNEFGDEPSLQGSIIPSEFIKPTDEIQSFRQIWEELKKNQIWQGDLVIKPIVSADGRDTYLITDKPELLIIKGDKYRSFSDAETIVQSLLEKKGSKGIIIQPFIKGVETSGEYQLVFFENQFSHATIKPKGFRNNVSVARTAISDHAIPPGMLDFAQKIINFYTKIHPYGLTRARLDFFIGEKGPVLCEAEVVEPHTNIRRFPVEQQKVIISNYAQALIRRTVGLKLQAILGDEAQTYFPMLNNPNLLKAIMKIMDTNSTILTYLEVSQANKKYESAKNYSAHYIKECLVALNDFLERNFQNKELLVGALADAKEGYNRSVLGKDRSNLSRAIRYLLAAVVNFVAALSFGYAHYQHYKHSGVVGFFTETHSARQLRKAHQELNQDLEQSFSL